MGPANKTGTRQRDPEPANGTTGTGQRDNGTTGTGQRDNGTGSTVPILEKRHAAAHGTTGQGTTGQRDNGTQGPRAKGTLSPQETINYEQLSRRGYSAQVPGM